MRKKRTPLPWPRIVCGAPDPDWVLPRAVTLFRGRRHRATDSAPAGSPARSEALFAPIYTFYLDVSTYVKSTGEDYWYRRDAERTRRLPRSTSGASPVHRRGGDNSATTGRVVHLSSDWPLRIHPPRVAVADPSGPAPKHCLAAHMEDGAECFARGHLPL